MRNKTTLVMFVAFFAIVLTLSSVLANTTNIVTLNEVKINDVVAASDGSVTVAGQVSEVVPVYVEFTACSDYQDVKVKVYIEGYKEDISASTDRIHIVDGSRYIERFSLKLPSSMDLDHLTEGLSLVVRVSAKGEDSVEKTYAIKMQRNLYSLGFLSVDAPQQITAGSSVPVDVVLENNGNERLDNVYVRASIPELGVEGKVYFGDLGPNPEEDADYYDEINDARSKRIYLAIPRNAAQGVYNLEVEAYNYDTSQTVTKKIVVGSVESGVLPTVTGKTIAPGKETTFDVVLVNPSDKLMVYSITPKEAKGLIVTVEEPVVALSSDSSKTVKVNVKAADSAEEGTHIVTIDVNSESGLVKQVSFNVNVEKNGSSITTTKTSAVMVLTVILVIIFVVLLIVLIVLLTRRRPTEPEEFGETSYY